MSLTLHVDDERWQAHLHGVLEAQPDLVPVTKGNGYGFGNARLAATCQSLGVDTIAVGTYPEVAQVATQFEGDILVLTPWRSSEDIGSSDPRVIHTVSRIADLAGISAGHRGTTPVRVVLERATSMRRHGMNGRDLRTAAASARDNAAIEVVGIALHLPLGARGNLREMERLMLDVVAAGPVEGPGSRTVWVSHLNTAELDTLRRHWPDYRFRPRVGTGLWLGDRGALRVSATVLDVHPVQRGDVYGYRGRTAPRAGAILVVSGGTAHGIGLEAPTGRLDMRSRASTFARGGLDAAGFVRSPFVIDDVHPLFAEPPHMQASMLFVPASAAMPRVGDEITVRCRFTTTSFDRVELDGPADTAPATD